MASLSVPHVFLSLVLYNNLFLSLMRKNLRPNEVDESKISTTEKQAVDFCPF
jgi:hypothetical protein